jgi:hypothetical protein
LSILNIEAMERTQEQIDKQQTNHDTYPEKARKKPLLTPEELNLFLDNYLQKQSENTDRKKR